MNEYSESWRQLKALLAGYTRRDSEFNAPSYEEQRHAKALSIFLTNAKLATPELNRETVEAVLAISSNGREMEARHIPAPKFPNPDSKNWDWCRFMQVGVL